MPRNGYTRRNGYSHFTFYQLTIIQEAITLMALTAFPFWRA